VKFFCHGGSVLSIVRRDTFFCHGGSVLSIVRRDIFSAA
jgi:hypothetical protein